MKRFALISLILATSALGSETDPAVLTSTGTSVRQGFNAGQKVLIQCDAAAYYIWGNSAVTVSSANGIKLAADEKIDSQSGANARYIAVISVSGTVNCKVFPVWGVK